METIEEPCRLRREKDLAFSIQHFWKKAEISYTWANLLLQAAGPAEKIPVRRKYRRRRERRTTRGVMLHLDASRTGGWRISRCQILVIMPDDDDWRTLGCDI